MSKAWNTEITGKDDIATFRNRYLDELFQIMQNPKFHGKEYVTQTILSHACDVGWQIGHCIGNNLPISVNFIEVLVDALRQANKEMKNDSNDHEPHMAADAEKLFDDFEKAFKKVHAQMVSEINARNKGTEREGGR